MRITSRLIATLVLMALALGGISLVSASGTPVATPGTTYDVAFHDTILTASNNALGLGDRFILRDDLLLDGNMIGHNSGVCTVTDLAGELLCTVSWSLPGGTIATQLINSPSPEKSFAITGGTGDYVGVRGAGELIEHGDGSDSSGGTGTVTFTFLD